MSCFDVIVVGGGGSGLATAVSAAEQGVRVCVLEKQVAPGGTTGIAVGSFTSNRTRFQKEAGITDQLEDHVIDAGRFAPPDIERHNNAALRRFFLNHSAEALHWLAGMGIRFQGPNPEPPNRQPRMHNAVPGAKAYIDTLVRRLQELGGSLVCGADVTELLMESGHVNGVCWKDTEGRVHRAGSRLGVVLAAGDYANAPDLIARFKGNDFQCIEGINPHASGDGHVLAEKAGARLLNMGVTYGPEIRFVPPADGTFQDRLPTTGWMAQWVGWLSNRLPKRWMQPFIKRLVVTWQHPEDALFDAGAILVNQNGERFTDERRSPQREIDIARQPNKQAYILLDESLIERFSAWPHFISTAPEIAYAYVKDYLHLRPDLALEADQLHALADKRGLPAENLEKTVRQLNLDRPKDASAALKPLSGNRWVLLGPAKAWFTTTEGGAAINESFEVLDASGAALPGLYAVGQNGLGGQILWGHGLHIGWAMTSGYLLGRQFGGMRR